jgi:hypothetical protein
MQQPPQADGYDARTIELLAGLEPSRRHRPARDKLILIQPDFDDPAYPGQRFYCWHCALMEGLLASFPYLAERLDVMRIAWPKPRAGVIALIGTENQTLPVLILAADAPDGLETGTANGHRFVEGKDAILRALSLRHGIPAPHP